MQVCFVWPHYLSCTSHTILPAPIVDDFLALFAKFRKTNISFVMSVPLSVRMEQLGFHRTDFHEIRYLSIFLIFVGEIQVVLFMI